MLREDRDGVAQLTLNRPDKLNALNVELFETLEAHVAAIEAAPVGMVVLRGADRCFSAGHDLRDIASGEKLPRANYQAHVIARLADLPLPVVTAVHGHCYTGALELALAGDIILAAESAKFGDTHAKWALTPVWGLSQRLPRRVGTYRAREGRPSGSCGRRLWPCRGSWSSPCRPRPRPDEARRPPPTTILASAPEAGGAAFVGAFFAPRPRSGAFRLRDRQQTARLRPREVEGQRRGARRRTARARHSDPAEDGPARALRDHRLDPRRARSLVEAAGRPDRRLAVSSRIRSDYHISTRQYGRLVDRWVAMIDLEPRAYGIHSLRRTKVAMLYKKTGNLAPVSSSPGAASWRAPCATSASRLTTRWSCLSRSISECRLSPR